MFEAYMLNESQLNFRSRHDSRMISLVLVCLAKVRIDDFQIEKKKNQQRKNNVINAKSHARRLVLQIYAFILILPLDILFDAKIVTLYSHWLESN